MNSREWLTIEDWLECNLPLCTLKIKHDGKLDRAEEHCVRIMFSSNKIGGNVLFNGHNQVSFAGYLLKLINLSQF